jgi:hypothetical protein
MHVGRKTVVAFATAGSLIVPALCQSQDKGIPWSQENVQAAIAGCKASILDHARKDYLTRHNLTESQLPPDFRERITPVIGPYLRICDCTITALSKEVPFERFQVNSPDVQQRLKKLVSKGGACEAKGT